MALLGLALFLLLILMIPPLHVKGRVDSLDIDEKNPFDWKELSFRAHVIGLFGALRLSIQQSAGAGTTTSQLYLFGFAKTLESSSDGKAKRRRQEGDEQRRSISPGANDADDEPSGRRRQRVKTKAKTRKKRSLTLSQLRQLWPEATWLIKQTIRKLRLDVQGRLTYGFSDPFVTGVVHGAVVVLPRLPKLQLQPDFIQGVLRGWAGFSLRLYPWQALWLLLQLAFRPGVRSLWWPRIKGALRIIPKPTKEVVNP